MGACDPNLTVAIARHTKTTYQSQGDGSEGKGAEYDNLSLVSVVSKLQEPMKPQIPVSVVRTTPSGDRWDYTQVARTMVICSWQRVGKEAAITLSPSPRRMGKQA